MLEKMQQITNNNEPEISKFEQRPVSIDHDEDKFVPLCPHKKENHLFQLIF